MMLRFLILFCSETVYTLPCNSFFTSFTPNLSFWSNSTKAFCKSSCLCCSTWIRKFDLSKSFPALGNKRKEISSRKKKNAHLLNFGVSFTALALMRKLFSVSLLSHPKHQFIPFVPMLKIIRHENSKRRPNP